MTQIYADFWDDFRFLGFARMRCEGTINSPPVEGWRAKRDGVVNNAMFVFFSADYADYAEFFDVFDLLSDVLKCER
jgi:hypothetical protein